MSVLAFPTRQNLSKKDATALLSDFRRALDKSDRAPKTAKAYLSDVAIFLTWLQGEGGAIDEPTSHDLKDWRQAMVGARLAPATINRRLAAVKVWCGTLGLGYNPTANVKGVEEVRPGPQSLARNEVNALLRAAERAGLLESALIEFLLGTGARIAEAAAVRIEDLEIGERSGWVTIRQGKGGKYRKVPLPADCRRTLAAFICSRGADAGRPDRGPLWWGQRGALTASGLYQIVKRLGQSAGVPVHPHSLRHSYARRILSGVSASGKPNQITDVQALLGHSSIRTTARYLVATETDLQKAVEASF